MRLGETMMRIQMYMWAFTVLALSSSSNEALACSSADAIGCVPFKTVKCPSNKLDISFLLDRSGSMAFAMEGGSAQNCPYEYPTTNQGGKSCKRQDIARMVIRDVLKEIFLQYQKNCLEYLQSSDARKYGSCADRGFTDVTFHLQWWASSAAKSYLNVQFTPTTSNGDMGKQFKDNFYHADGTIIADKWSTTNGVVTMKDDEIEYFFERVLLASSTVAAWPSESSKTKPHTGLNAIYSVLQGVFNDYSDEQKANARFPIFMMTDGYVGSTTKEMQSSINLLKGVTGTQSQINLYGLGLTAQKNLELKKHQEDFYSKYDFIDRITVPTATGQETIEMYFNNDVTSKKVVSAIFQSVNEGCQDCYELGGVKKCVDIGQPVPSFNTNNGSAPEVEPDNKPVGTLNVAISETTSSFDKYVGVGNDIFKIPQQTTLCTNYYEDQGGNAYNGHFFININNGKCQCCEEMTQLCLCDYTAQEAIGTRTITIGTGDTAFDLDISVYDKNSDFAAEISNINITGLNVTDTLSLQDVFNGTVEEEQDDINGGGENGGGENGGGENGGGENGGGYQPGDQGDATRTVSLIMSMALPLMAAIM